MVDGGSVHIAVDVGGTFTDVVLVDAHGQIAKAKVLSTPPDYGRAVLRGLESVTRDHGSAAGSVAALFHGTTVATNAVLEGRGAVTALVTTEGFRDSLELARGRRPGMYDLTWAKPTPLVPRRRRFEVKQRITMQGDLDPPVDLDDMPGLVDRLEAAGVESVAICLINSYVRPDEERRLADALRAALPGVPVTASVDLSPEAGEYERASTAVVNAYVAPVVSSYLERLEGDFRKAGMDAPFYVMQSSGGLLRSVAAREQPVHLIESGPAAGVIAVRALARELGISDAIAFDMGGTTAKATLVEGGEALETAQYEVGAGMNAKPGLNVGAGYPVRTTSLDIAEVGAGGGSIFWVDPGGAPHVGPQSAGAQPGPACYGAGGTAPTLSDANLLLGYLNPAAIAGGTQVLHPALAEQALKPVADQLEISILDAAYGAYEIAVANMTRLLRAVTSERGRDPRRATLVAFGGAGPTYACALARELEIRRILVPPASGVFSAVGLLVADPQHDLIRPYDGSAFDHAGLDRLFAEMEVELVDALVDDGYDRKQIVVSRFVDMRYSGQTMKMRIPVPSGTLTVDALDLVLDTLDAEHLRTFGHHKARDAATIEAARLRAYVDSHDFNPSRALAATNGVRADSDGIRERDAYFGREHGTISTPIVRRQDLQTEPRTGPLVVEEMDSTILVTPDAVASLDRLRNIVIEVA